MTNTVTVNTRDEFRKRMSALLSQGYVTQHQDAVSVTLARKKPFNWLVAIICLFIPVIGWIALFMMLKASTRGSEVIEIVLDTPIAHQA